MENSQIVNEMVSLYLLSSGDDQYSKGSRSAIEYLAEGLGLTKLFKERLNYIK